MLSYIIIFDCNYINLLYLVNNVYVNFSTIFVEPICIL